MSLALAEGDAIHLEELELSARVGVPEEERAQAQRLTLCLTLWPEVPFSELGDEIAKAVDYAAVAHDLQRFVAHREDRLIETLAEAVAIHLLAAFPLVRVRLELRKFILPEVKYVAAQLTRERSRGA